MSYSDSSQQSHSHDQHADPDTPYQLWVAYQAPRTVTCDDCGTTHVTTPGDPCPECGAFWCPYRHQPTTADSPEMCGRTFDSKRGLKAHHSRTHDLMWPKFRQCPNCDGHFQVKTNRPDQEFCSRKCVTDAKQTDDGECMVTCKHCGKTEKKPRGGMDYCSKAHWAEDTYHVRPDDPGEYLAELYKEDRTLKEIIARVPWETSMSTVRRNLRAMGVYESKRLSHRLLDMSKEEADQFFSEKARSEHFS